MTTRRILVTSGLPYANGPLHLGHVLEAIQTDAFARFQRLQGHECLYCCAEDCHGSPVMLKAEAMGLTIDELLALAERSHRATYDRLGIEFASYLRTHSPENEALVQSMWQSLCDHPSDLVAERDIEQAYDATRGMFLADRQILATCPRCGAIDQYADLCEVCGATYSTTEASDVRSALSNTVPEVRQSRHLLIDLSKLKDALHQHVHTGDVPDSLLTGLSAAFTSDPSANALLQGDRSSAPQRSDMVMQLAQHVAPEASDVLPLDAIANVVIERANRATSGQDRDQLFAVAHRLQSQKPQADSVLMKLNEWLKGELKPWDVSRDSPYFGIPIPGQPGKYFYVWLDAPIGYFAALQSALGGADALKEWLDPNSDVEIHHVIGKDIVYFHCLFWPAVLSAASWKRPTRVHVHGFITATGGAKMSKSAGNAISADALTSAVPVDFIRFGLACRLGRGIQDVEFSVDDLIARCHSDLVGKLVNIPSRCGALLSRLDARPSLTSGEELLAQWDQSPFAECFDAPSQHLQGSDYLTATLRRKACGYHPFTYETPDLANVVTNVMKCCDAINTVLAATAPWKMMADDPEGARTILTHALALYRVVMLHISPIVPDLQARSDAWLGVSALRLPQEPDGLTLPASGMPPFVAEWLKQQSHLLPDTIPPYAPLLTRLKLDDVHHALNEAQSQPTPFDIPTET